MGIFGILTVFALFTKFLVKFNKLLLSVVVVIGPKGKAVFPFFLRIGQKRVRMKMINSP